MTAKTQFDRKPRRLPIPNRLYNSPRLTTLPGRRNEDEGAATLPRPGAVTRYLMLLPALIFALSLAFTPTASAQTAVPFRAKVNGIRPKPKPPCPTTAFCGTASIAGYGAATWTFDPTPTMTVSSACFAYTAETTFRLLSDGSTLVLNENALACAPGNSVAPPQSFGDPLYSKNSSWTVEAATGQFSGLTGVGTDTLRTDGARASGTYSGTLLNP